MPYVLKMEGKFKVQVRGEFQVEMNEPISAWRETVLEIQEFQNS